MRKRCLAALLVLVLFVSVLPAAGAASAPTQEQVYASMIALKSSYPEGMRWTNDNFYGWKGGVYSGGYGCAGFAFMLSDAAFGELPARKVTGFQYSDVKVGDILRINNGTHSVIVLEVHEDNVILAEGNYNSSIHWGRSLSRQDVMNSEYLMTRYPEQPTEPEQPAEPEQPTEPEQPAEPEQPTEPTLPQVEDIPAQGTAVASTQTVLLDGRQVEFQCYALPDERGNLTNYVKIRDLALALNGTKAQSNAAWDGQQIIIEPGTAFAADGTENMTPYSGTQSYESLNGKAIGFNGGSVYLTSFSITYQGGGYTYYKFKDLGQLLNFNVKWSDGVVIETDKPYTGK